MVKIKVGSGGGLKRWSTLKYSNITGNPDAIVTRVNNRDGAITLDIYPYEEVDCGRVGRIVWFFCLKLCVYLKLV